MNPTPTTERNGETNKQDKGNKKETLVFSFLSFCCSSRLLQHHRIPPAPPSAPLCFTELHGVGGYIAGPAINPVQVFST
jgi:hypothetical protein